VYYNRIKWDKIVKQNCGILVSWGISDSLLFMAFLIGDWKFLLGSFVAVWKLLISMKFCILELYCRMGKITEGFPLSVHVIIASLFWSLHLMFLIVFASGCVK